MSPLGPEDPSIPAGPCREARRDGAQQLLSQLARVHLSNVGWHPHIIYLHTPEAGGATLSLQALRPLKNSRGVKSSQNPQLPPDTPLL